MLTATQSTLTPAVTGPKTFTAPPRMRRPLIAGVLRDAANPPRRVDSFSFEERDRVRAAAADGRDVSDRTIDQVVDRLLKELSW